MKVAVIYNKKEFDENDVISKFGLANKEFYSPETVESVASSLEKGGHNIRVIEGNKNVIEALQNFMPRVISGESPGMVFNMAYGIQGRSRYTHIPALLEMMGIPYLGSSPSGHAIALDKVLSKIIFLRNNLPTAKYRVISSIDEDFNDINYFPLIVKPRNEAVSMGMKIVNNTIELIEAAKPMLEEQQQVFAEEFIPGREFAIGVLGNGNMIETLPIVEIDLNGDPNAIQTYDDKTTAPKDKICPAPLQKELEEKLIQLTKDSFNALGLNDFARVDFRVSEKGEIYILEINSMASLGKSGSFYYASKVAGYSYTGLVNKMLDVAAYRYFGNTVNKMVSESPNPKSTKESINIRVRSYLRSQLPTIEDNLKRIVNINSHSANIDGNNKIGKFISDKFSVLGFNRQVFPQSECGNINYFTNHTDETNDVLLLCHSDTVFDYENSAPFDIDKSKLIGSGIAESKGGLTITLAALQSLKFNRALKNIRVGVLISTDDTTGGKFSKKIINDVSNVSKLVIGMKHSEGNGDLVTSCSGAIHYNIEVSNIKSELKKKEDLVGPVAKKLLALQKLSSEFENINVFIRDMKLQTNSTMRADYAFIKLVLLYKHRNQKDNIDKRVKEIITKGFKKGIQSQIKRVLSREPFEASSMSERIFNRIENIAKNIETNIGQTHRNISSNICHVSINIPSIEGLGPGGFLVRTPNEHILRDSIIDRATLLAMVIYESKHF